jgi:hypothetical protein
LWYTGYLPFEYTIELPPKSNGCGSFTTTFVNTFRPFLLLYTRKIILLDYFQAIASDSQKRKTSRWNDAPGIESLMVSFVLAGLMEAPVFVEVATGSKGAQSQNGLGAV